MKLGASFKPKQNPISTNMPEIIANDRLNPKISQQIANGMLTVIMARRRPILSQMGPLKRLPMGCAIAAKLATRSELRQTNFRLNFNSKNIFLLNQKQTIE